MMHSDTKDILKVKHLAVETKCLVGEKKISKTGKIYIY